MPAYDRPIVINSQRPPYKDSVAAVLKFNSNDLERVQAWLDRAAEAGIIQLATAKAYDSNVSSPELYFP